MANYRLTIGTVRPTDTNSKIRCISQGSTMRSEAIHAGDLRFLQEELRHPSISIDNKYGLLLRYAQQAYTHEPLNHALSNDMVCDALMTIHLTKPNSTSDEMLRNHIPITVGQLLTLPCQLTKHVRYTFLRNHYEQSFYAIPLQVNVIPRGKM